MRETKQDEDDLDDDDDASSSGKKVRSLKKGVLRRSIPFRPFCFPPAPRLYTAPPSQQNN